MLSFLSPKGQTPLMESPESPKLVSEARQHRGI